MFRLIIISIFFVFALNGQDFERIAPKKPISPTKSSQKKEQPIEKSNDKSLLMEKLKGIRLVGTITSVQPSASLKIEGVQIVDLCFPGSYKQIQRMLKCFLDKPLTKKDLVAIKRAIILYYQRYNRPIVDVYVPQQNISNGGVQIVVFESKLANVTVEGNCHFCDNAYLSQIRNRKNCPINTETLVEDLDWLNQNPFRQADAIFVPSIEEGFTDIQIHTTERSPVRFYTGVENSGLDLTGHNRWLFGINYGNFLGYGHLFSYQFMMGTHYNEFYAHSFSYIVPLNWRHTLTLFGGYSEIEAILPTENRNAIANNDLENESLMKTHGLSAQGSFRYSMPLCRVYNILQNTIIGFDYKRTDTSLTIGGDPFVGEKVNLTQFMLGYNQGYECGFYKQGLTFELFFSPFQWLPDQSNTRFNSLRQGAKNTYIYGRAVWNPVFSLPWCMTLAPTFRWQLSSTNLLASEQMGLGGYNSVRGYEERSINIDNGVIVNIDLSFRPIPIFSFFRKARCMNEGLVLVAFFDLGYGKNHLVYEGEKEDFLLYSVGPAFRYHLGDNVSIRADWGYQLKKFPNSNRDQMFQFGAVFSF